MICFYMECNTELKRVNPFRANVFIYFNAFAAEYWKDIKEMGTLRQNKDKDKDNLVQGNFLSL